MTSAVTPRVTIYTTPLCPYCSRARHLLAAKAANIHTIDVGGDRSAREALAVKAGGRRTVPQIWIGDRHIGGCDDLFALERSGQLDVLLAV